jgi:hypothetical protein
MFGTTSSNVTLSGTTYFDAIASKGVTRVAFELSGGPNNYTNAVIAYGALTLYGWLATWNTSQENALPPGTVPNGTYTIRAVAYYVDGGNSGASSPIPVTISN